MGKINVDFKKLFKAFSDPENVRFIERSSGSPRIAIRIEDQKIHEKFSMIDGIIRENIDDIVSEYRSIQYAYFKFINPDFEFPEDVDLEEIEYYTKRMESYASNPPNEENIKMLNSIARHDVSEEVSNPEQFHKIVYAANIATSFVCSFLVPQIYEEILRDTSVGDEIKEFRAKKVEEVLRRTQRAKEVDTGTFYTNLAALLMKKSDIMKLVYQIYGIRPLADQGVIYILENALSREEFEYFIENYGDCILDRKKVVEYLTTPRQSKDEDSKAGIYTLDELKQRVSKNSLNMQFVRWHDKELLNYMTPDQLIQLYVNDEIDDGLLRKHTTLDDIIDSSVDHEDKFKALMRCARHVIYTQNRSDRMWQLAEKGEFSIVEIKQLEDAGFFSIDRVVKQYIESSKRKIAGELGEVPQISDEKLLQYFTPDRILEFYNRNQSGDMFTFITQTVKALYKSYGMSIEEEITKYLSEKDSKDNSNSKKIKDTFASKGFKLYEDGLASIDILKALNVPTEEVISYCQEHKDNIKLLIDVFNAELVSEDTMFEEVLDMDFDLACSFIQKGMSARIIRGLESTKTLIEMTRPTVDEEGNEVPPILTFKNLAEIKEDIETGIDDRGMNSKVKGKTSLVDLYLSDELSYSELYDLAQAGVITMDEANLIDEKYNLIKDWDKLKEKGIQGKSILGRQTGILGLTSTPGIGAGIDESCILDYYIAMGANEYLEIDPKQCPVFKNYIIFPVVEKRVAYLESKDGRTYIVPLKIVLEQINNPKGQLDLIGNARSKNEFNSQKDYIQSANHTKGWGRKVTNKTALLPFVQFDDHDAEEFIRANSSIIRAIEHSYDARRLAAIRQNNAQQIP